MKLNKTILTLIFAGFHVIAYGQKLDYLFPIKPGVTNALSGTMGELRATHFHTGLDIKTDGVEGLPVYSAQDGYVSRIYVSPGGYGHALYVTHPDGNTTVYAHLQRFNEEIAAYVLNEQYRIKSFYLNKYLTKEQFQVNRGDIIAFSGNSGSSAGPHLHWDLRDPHQRPLNPLTFNFSEVRDTRSPAIQKVALKTMDKDARINGQFGRFEIEVSQNRVLKPLSLEGNIGVEVLAYDVLNDSGNRCGINDLGLSVDGEKVYQCDIDKLSFAQQRSIYVYYDYPGRMANGARYHKLYIEDGNDLIFYENSPANGIVRFHKDREAKLNINLTDTYGNLSIVEIQVNDSKQQHPRLKNIPDIQKTSFFIQDNTLIFSTEAREGPTPVFLKLKNNEEKQLESSYFAAGKDVFLYDLREGIPELIQSAETSVQTNLKEVITPGKSYQFYDDHLDISFGNSSLFDTLYLQTAYRQEPDGKEYFTIGNLNVPLKKSVSVTLKPEEKYHPQSKAYSVGENGELYYEGGKWENGKLTLNTAFFNTFTIVRDTVPPTIIPLSLAGAEVRFKISDDMSGIARTEARINGEWLLMHSDPKTNRIWSERKDKNKTLKGELVLKVTDNTGNEQIFKHKIE
ncbi:MAG: M23 family metallopeptidase [Cyclobacteriaceae bacterium]|nr:M23 family metallopeptidase [Cyclobacteriaceae bacterium]